MTKANWPGVVTICIFGLLQEASDARPVSFPKLSVMWKEADLVAVIVPEATGRSSDLLTSAGPRYGPRNLSNYQGLNTRCRVLDILKADGKAGQFAAKKLTVLHFAYVRGPLEWDGAVVIYFHLPPVEYLTFAVPIEDRTALPNVERNNFVARDQPTLLAFLRIRDDGRFEAITGNYDSAPSFRILGQTLSGAMIYARNGVAGRE